MSIPLLLERRSSGRGPKVPLRVPFTQVVVEGLNPDDRVAIYCNGETVINLGACGIFDLPRPFNRDDTVQAELIGTNSCVSVRLEKT